VAFINEGVIVAMDEPKNLKLQYGENAVEVEHSESGRVDTEVFSLSSDEDRGRFHTLVDTGNIRTIHTREATLEQIFMQLTGRGLE
jgi:fluoroquinolone transport system ATP-binding protein